MGNDVGAALANWNGAAHLPHCLQALRSQTLPLHSITVVDNGSSDGSDVWLEEQADVGLLRNESNLGYCAGYNRAIDAISTEYVLVLNTDVTLHPSFVQAAVDVLDAHPQAGAVTGRFHEEATNRTISGGFRLRRQMRMCPETADEVERDVFGASGAAVLFRRSALQDVAEVAGEVYDPSYFAYGEDIDLAWRMRSRGWTVRYVPGVEAHHIGSGSLGGALRFIDKPPFFQRHVLKNRYLTVLKNAPTLLLWELLLVLMVTDAMLWPYLCVRQPRRVSYLLGSITDVLRLLPSVWQRRRRLRERDRLGAAAVRPWLQGV